MTGSTTRSSSTSRELRQLAEDGRPIGSDEPSKALGDPGLTDQLRSIAASTLKLSAIAKDLIVENRKLARSCSLLQDAPELLRQELRSERARNKEIKAAARALIWDTDGAVEAWARLQKLLPKERT